jgi:hypothetical protein
MVRHLVSSAAAQDIQPAGTTDVTTATTAVLTADGAKPADGEPMVMAAMLRQGPLPAAPTTSIGEGLSNFKTLKALLAKAGIDASAIFPSYVPAASQCKTLLRKRL